jgi:hypothetical protein
MKIVDSVAVPNLSQHTHTRSRFHKIQ